MTEPEQLIHENLIGEDLHTALEFMAYLRQLGTEIIRDTGFWKNKIYFYIRRGETYAGYIAIRDPDEPDNRWTVWSDTGSPWYERKLSDNALEAVGLAHIDFCGHCGSCPGGTKKIIFGRAFDNVCGTMFRFDNPGEKELAFMKEMIRLRLAEAE